MFANNNTTNYNNNKIDNVNTNIKTFFGDTASLQLSYWSDKISIKINPIQNVSSEGLRQYDYNKRIQTALTVENTTALANAIGKYILPRLDANNQDNGKEISVSVKGQKILTTFSYKKENGTDNVYLTLTPVNTDGSYDTTNAYTYKFNTNTIVIDAITNEPKTETSYSELLFVYNKFKNFVNVLGDSAHSINLDNSFKANRSANFNTQSNQSNTQNDYNAPVSSFSGIGDML